MSEGSPTSTNTKNEVLSGESRDGGPTASSSQSDKHQNTLLQKCVRCDERQMSIGMERRKNTLKWLLQSPEASQEEEPESSLAPVGGPTKEKPHVGFRYGSLKEDARPGPLCKSCFAKETVGKTVVYIAFWYLAYALLEGYKTSKIGERLANFPAPRLLQALFFLTQAGISALFRQTKWGRKPSPIAGISWRSYFLRVVPPGIANAIDINIAIPHPSIPDSCTALSKSATPFLVLLMTYAFHLEIPTIKLTTSITSFTTGTLLAVGRALNHSFGLTEFALHAAVSVVTAFRWTGTQILLQVCYHP
ncbi:hypothetical protein KC19_1G079800 [Ceratodon purpureus]|uniref:Uncharacterized protein n=1 Tax=Ceratodon purpureus TaxID=3225 RepID=A0A8T0J4N3_CERPU|nr:hypothetical protein KC19_1G079800 [Ceratodon purpureus]